MSKYLREWVESLKDEAHYNRDDRARVKADELECMLDHYDRLRADLAETEERDNDACPIRFNDHPEHGWPTTEPFTIPNIDALESDPEGYGTYAIKKLCEFARDLAAESERRGTELQQHQWRSIESAPPEIGSPILGYNEAWIDPDFNPLGIRECFLYGDGTMWMTAKWCNDHDCYHTTTEDAPTHWRPLPTPPEASQ